MIKKTFLMVLLLFSSSFLFAQILTSSIANPNAGGGTVQLLNPSKTANGAASNWSIFNMSGSSGNSLQFWAYDNLGCGSGLCAGRFVLMDNGNVGVGIMPNYKLEINGDFALPYTGKILSSTGPENNIVLHNGYGIMKFATANQDRLIISYSGNVGIGIQAPAEKLSVNGNIRAKELKVETANWPDYVFEPDYKMTSLTDLETYIKVNKHLPEMPTAKEVETDGITVGEMLKLQQKKIEELTLQLIELNKKVDAQQKQIIASNQRL